LPSQSEYILNLLSLSKQSSHYSYGNIDAKYCNSQEGNDDFGPFLRESSLGFECGSAIFVLIKLFFCRGLSSLFMADGEVSICVDESGDSVEENKSCGNDAKHQ